MKNSTSARRNSSLCTRKTWQAMWVNLLHTESSTTSSPRTLGVRGHPKMKGAMPKVAPCHLTSSYLLCRHHYGAGIPHKGAESGPLCVPRIGTEGSVGPRQLPPLLPALLPCTLYVWLPCGQVCRPGAQGCPQGHDQNVCGTALCCLLCCGSATLLHILVNLQLLCWSPLHSPVDTAGPHCFPPQPPSVPGFLPLFFPHYSWCHVLSFPALLSTSA